MHWISFLFIFLIFLASDLLGFSILPNIWTGGSNESWRVLTHPGGSWLILEGKRCILEDSDMYWWVLEDADGSWRVLVDPELSWHIFKALSDLDGSLWLQTYSAGLGGSCRVLTDSGKVLMDPEGSGTSQAWWQGMSFYFNRMMGNIHDHPS